MGKGPEHEQLIYNENEGSLQAAGCILSKMVVVERATMELKTMGDQAMLVVQRKCTWKSGRDLDNTEEIDV